MSKNYILTALLCFAISGPASAFSCLHATPQPVEAYYKNDALFVGKIVSAETLNMPEKKKPNYDTQLVGAVVIVPFKGVKKSQELKFFVSHSSLTLDPVQELKQNEVYLLPLKKIEADSNSEALHRLEVCSGYFLIDQKAKTINDLWERAHAK